MRALAQGLPPALLTEAGIGVALQAAAAQLPLGATVRADGLERYSDDVESTVYFACLEALQNAVKHADGATRVTIDLHADGRLRFEVRDDGAGFRGAPAEGSGLRNMRDRLAAPGGSLDVDSHTDRGTSVVGTIPIDAAARRREPRRRFAVRAPYLRAPVNNSARRVRRGSCARAPVAAVSL